MKFELIDLPYHYSALEPFISERTVEIHHTKHHAGYVQKLDKALAGDELREHSLEHILLASSGVQFNLAAQVWNHDFYWKSLTSQAEMLADGSRLRDLLVDEFGGMEAFKAAFKDVATEEFGSGWAWLAYSPESKHLEVFSTTDALNPLTSGRVPLLTLDVWEHAYYLDYQNDRAGYIDEFLDAHINWAFAEHNLVSHLQSLAAEP